MTSRGAEKMNNDTIGVDVSKDHLDAHRLADGAARWFANDRGGHKALIKWLAQTPRYRVVFEPTGPYHRAVERALGIAGVPFVKVNPRQARRFAEATGKLAKTDRLDAAILARMGALLELQARPARSEILLELKELYVAREALVKDRTAARNRGKVLTLSLLKRQNAQRLEQIDRQIATVEAAILEIIEADASLADRFAILTSIPGVSTITAFALLIAMRELGALEAGQAANLAGLAPIARQSGRWTGRSFIRGGRADVRQALYMPALVAARFNPDMKAKYAHLIETGKPAKVALTAIMRKLVVLANALLKANRLGRQKPLNQLALTGRKSFTYRARTAEARLRASAKRRAAARRPPIRAGPRREWKWVTGRSRRRAQTTWLSRRMGRLPVEMPSRPDFIIKLFIERPIGSLPNVIEEEPVASQGRVITLADVFQFPWLERIGE